MNKSKSNMYKIKWDEMKRKKGNKINTFKSNQREKKKMSSKIEQSFIFWALHAHLFLFSMVF